MKKLLLIIVTFLGVYSVNLYAQVSLGECREAARLNYPLIVQYKLLDLTKDYRIENINRAYLPQISISAKATFQSEVTKVPINVPGMTIIPLDKDQYGATLQAEQILWDGGVGKAQKEIVKASVLSDKKRVDSEVYQIYERVNQVYFGILLIDENLKLTNLFISELNRSLDKISAGVQTGLANQSDIDMVSVEILNATQKETELKSNRVAFLAMLNSLTGKKIESTDSFEYPENTEILSSVENLRPELEAFEAQKLFINSQKRAIDAKNMLKIGAFLQGGYGKPGLNMLKNEFDSYLIGGIKLSWNFGGYYTKRNEVAQLNLSTQLVDVQKSTFLFNLNIKNSQQLENLNKIRSMLKNDTEIIELRSRIAEASEAKFNNGTISLNDYISDLTKLDMVRRIKSAREIEYLNALYEYKNTLNN